jgi:hypothetical protein
MSGNIDDLRAVDGNLRIFPTAQVVGLSFIPALAA